MTPDCCPACKKSFARVPRAPILHVTWAKLADRDELLCANCFFDRAEKRRVRHCSAPW